MNKQIVLVFMLFALFGCSAADVKMFNKQLADSINGSIKKTPTRTKSKKASSKKIPNNNIAVVNSNLPECRGITLHRAYVHLSPFYYGGKVAATIPVNKVVITNHGKRRKVIFDIYYKQDFGNRKYGTKQPTGHYLKEFGPVTLRANIKQHAVTLEKPKGKEVYERVELVSCE